MVKLMKPSDGDAVGANLSNLAARGANRYSKYADKDGDSSGSNSPRGSACPSEGLRNPEVGV